MAADFRDDGEHVIAELLGDNGQVRAGDLFQIDRGINVG
jgi:hypothetical protein